MSDSRNTQGTVAKDELYKDIVETVRSITEETGTTRGDELGPETMLGADLGLKSLDFIRLITALQQKYSNAYIPFQELFVGPDGMITPDISLSRVVDFVGKHRS
jgi:acyl carrier protein